MKHLFLIIVLLGLVAMSAQVASSAEGTGGRLRQRRVQTSAVPRTLSPMGKLMGILRRVRRA